MSATTAYWDTSDGQALQWSLVSIGAILIAVGTVACAAYFCFKCGRDSIKPKLVGLLFVLQFLTILLFSLKGYLLVDLCFIYHRK